MPLNRYYVVSNSPHTILNLQMNHIWLNISHLNMVSKIVQKFTLMVLLFIIMLISILKKFNLLVFMWAYKTYRDIFLFNYAK